MFPFLVSTVGTIHWRLNCIWITICPIIVDKIIKLFCPKQPSKTLSLNLSQLVTNWIWCNVPIKFISLSLTFTDNIVQLKFINFWFVIGKFVTDSNILPSWDIFKCKPSSGFCSLFFWVDYFLFPINDIFMESVFNILAFIILIVQFFRVGFIFCEN